MKKLIGLFLVGLMAWAAVPAAQAQDGDGAMVTQGELAQRLVQRLGLWRFLATPKPTDAECFAALMSAGITFSKDGFKADEPVTAAMLARVLVLSLGGGKRVPAESQDDPQAWMDALKDMMVDMNLLETVEGSLSVLTPDEGVKNVVEWFSLSVDELRRRQVGLSDTIEIFTGGIVFPQADVTPDFVAPGA